MLDCGVVVSKFKFQLHCFIQFHWSSTRIALELNNPWRLICHWTKKLKTLTICLVTEIVVYFFLVPVVNTYLALIVIVTFVQNSHIDQPESKSYRVKNPFKKEFFSIWRTELKIIHYIKFHLSKYFSSFVLDKMM